MKPTASVSAPHGFNPVERKDASGAQPTELKDVTDALQRTHNELKSFVEREEKELKELGAATSETKASIEKTNARLDELEKKQQRMAVLDGGTERKATDTPTEQKAAFLSWARKGQVGETERKALSVSNDTTGGYLAPSEFVRELIKGVTEFSPVREVARVRPTSSKSSKHPKRTGQFAAQWVAEQGTRSETDGLRYGLEEIPNHELYALVDISNEDLEDSAFNLDAELSSEGVEQFAVAEGTSFISGNGVGKSEGILTHADIGEVVSGDANLIKADGLIDLVYALKDAYARNASFLLKRSTIGAIRKLKDATSGQFLWQPGLNGPTSNTLLGYAYREAVDMPAVGAGLYPVLFGDYRKGYVISDRIAISVVRDNVTQATSGNVRFIMRKRVGGQVVLAEAIKKLKIAAS